MQLDFGFGTESCSYHLCLILAHIICKSWIKFYQLSEVVYWTNNL